MITAARESTVVPAAGEWTHATVLGHVSMVDAEVWTPRLEVMVSTITPEPPTFTWWAGPL